MRASQRFSGGKIAEILVEKHAGYGLNVSYLQIGAGIIHCWTGFSCTVVAESSPEHCVELTFWSDTVR